ncbi:MAG: hypothetical protein ACJ757_13700 [Gaiellaceae bacterium]
MSRTVLIAAAAFLAACSVATGTQASPRPAAILGADIVEWSIVPSSGVVRAGSVRIRVRNLGYEPHQLMVVRTREFAQDLRLQGDRAVARPVGSPVLVAPGRTASFVVHLKRGSYLLIDNLPWHYWKGTQAAFAVR